VHQSIFDMAAQACLPAASLSIAMRLLLGAANPAVAGVCTLQVFAHRRFLHVAGGALLHEGMGCRQLLIMPPYRQPYVHARKRVFMPGSEDLLQQQSKAC